MYRIGRFLSLAVMVLAAAAPAACTGKDPYNPGESLGTFHVSGKLVASSCGTVPDPWEFDVRINHDGTARTIYWLQGGAPIKGEVDTTSRALLESQAVYTYAEPDAKKKLPGCAITRVDALDVVLATSDAKPPTTIAATAAFSGKLGYSFTPTNDSDCNAALAQDGGDFDALPCEVRYDITAALTKK